ncbi:hypothetical protein MIND_01180900 [Mycena indigotica]|uniref:Spindle assembly checkpoint component MAD1 n=1 Tax=Mycena indigotica TaxID=2126181 RepID=A0A8H6S445_9AGAR|nr:uncharacterized protein MIND_01180900 [Mycena indigotica]KAF7292820.1 hypothetical protein MIND_01180900 [Mycena indigotica]
MSATCALCKRQFSKYNCPTCNVPYCSLACFRSQAHSQCSETFYKKELEDGIRGQPSKTAQERQQMLELLKRFEEESAEQEGLEEDYDDEVSQRFMSLDLDATDSDELWSLLTPEERDRFLKAMADPSSELTARLLASEELQHDKLDPWWTMSTNSSLPDVILIPPSLKTPNRAGPPLIYNICSLFIAYSFITRHLAISPLFQASELEADAARDLFSQLTPFLTARASKTLLSTLDITITEMLSRLPSTSNSPQLLAVLLRDASTLLKPALVVELEHETPHINAMRVLGDVQALFISRPHVSHKLTFYAAYLSTFVARLAAMELEAAAKTRETEVEEDQRASQAGSKRDSLAAELERDPQLSTAKRQQRAQAFTSQMAHSALERQLLAAQTSKMELESKLREKELQVEKLERDRRWFSDREQGEREEKERERAEYQEQVAARDKELRTLRSTLTALREEFDDLKDSHSSLSRTTTQTIASQKSQIATLTRQSALLEDEVSQFRLLADERSHTIENIQAQLDGLENAPRPIADQEEKDMQIVREELHRQAAYLRTLEATNARLAGELAILKERHTSIEVLREENRSLERKLQPMEELQEKTVQLEAQLEAARREREAWARTQPEPSSSSSTPIALTTNLSSLRLQNAQLLEDHGATTALLRAKEAELVNAETRISEYSDRIAKLENQSGILQDRLARAEQRASLADREVGFMKALVSSYSLEEANNKTEAGPTIMDAARLKQLEQLEALLETYKAANLKLSQQLNEAATREPIAVSRAREQELESEKTARLEAEQSLETAIAEYRLQLEKIEGLEQELHELSGEIAGGRHVPPGVRVLSFADTPELLGRDNPQARKAELDKVKEENTALIQRIEALEQGGAHLVGESNTSAIPKESWDKVCEERDQLQALVKQKEKRLQRLQEVFQSKAKEFRESVESLLGVKLAFFQSGQVRVTSSFDHETTFVFKPSSDGTSSLQLTGTGEGGFEDCEQLMAYWVNTEQCIPGFLASVTLELYDKKKQER